MKKCLKKINHFPQRGDGWRGVPFRGKFLLILSGIVGAFRLLMINPANNNQSYDDKYTAGGAANRVIRTMLN